MHRLMSQLYPIPRSITGDGIRETFRVIGEEIPLEAHRVPSGTRVFDWEVPREWQIRDAYIRSPDGEKIVDFRDSSLHVVGYSTPVDRRIDLDELRQHIHTVPEHPDWIPFRASYYEDNWGFCMSHNRLASLGPGMYDVRVDSSLEPGYLDYAECHVRGELDEEILISAHACHPALCNDNLSGVVLAVAIARLLLGTEHRFSYRFLFIPSIIGSIVWLSRNEDACRRIRAGLVVSCVGDGGDFRYKRTRRGDTVLDRAAEHVLTNSGHRHSVVDFYPYGYDERNYCSPGFDLPVGSLTRSSHGTFPEYHTSADDLEFVKAAFLGESLSVYATLLEVLENNGVFVNRNPKCEPQLGRRGLYNVTGGLKEGRSQEMAMFWLLNQCDGTHSLLDIAEKSRIPFDVIACAGARLHDAGLLVEGSA